MRHSIRNRGDILNKAPKGLVPSATSTPSIRPSNSFMEKMLRDCLKPRKYQPITDEMVRSDSSGGEGSERELQPSREGIPASESASETNSNTPRRHRRWKDGKHASLGADQRSISPPWSAKATPSRSVSSQTDERGLYSSVAADNRYRKGATKPNTTPPRNHRRSIFRPREPLYGPFFERVQTTPPRRKHNRPRDDLPMTVDVRMLLPPRTPPRNSKFNPPNREYGPMMETAKPIPLGNFIEKDHRPTREYGPVTHDAETVTRRNTRSSKPQPRIPHTAVAQPMTPRAGGNENRRPHHQQQHRDAPPILLPNTSPPPLFASFQEEREQALRDYKVTIEYKHLKSHAPGGVYLIPSMDSLRNFHGIIFVRRGPFTNGIFKFQLNLPAKYNDANMWPRITFSSRVYNPYVNEETGQLDVETAYPTWDPSRHYLVTVLTYLKKIFYSKNFADAKANPAARDLAEKDPQAYKKKVEACVHESQKKVYVNEKGSTAKFTEEEVAHRVLRDLLKHHIRNDNQVTKHTILAQVDKARKV